MAEHGEPNLDGDGAKSYFQRTVVLRNWWLIKCSNEFEGKRFGVAGTEDSVETRAMRVFTSSPIIEALDVFTLLASDGIYITLRGFLNKERLVKSGFIPQISHEFIFGFPPCWERICNSCFRGDSFGTNVNTVPSKINKACSPIFKPCKNMKRNQESRDKSTVTTGEIGIKDGSRARDQKTARRKFHHLQSKSGEKIAEDERKLESTNVQKTTNDVDHCGADLNKAKSSDVERDECEAISNEENERKLDESKVQNRTNDRDHGSEGLNKAKSNDVEVISPVDGCGKRHFGTDGVEKLTSKNATKESLTSEQRKGRVEVTKKSQHSLLKDLNDSRTPGKEGKSKEREKALKSDLNVAEENMSWETEEDLSWGKTKRKIDFDVEVTQDKETKKQNTNVQSSDSLGQKRSRSGRVLVSSLEFWRNQIPVYDMDRNLTQVKEGRQTKGKGSYSRKPKKKKIK